MTTTQIHPALEPARIGHVQLPNRLAVAPMTRISAQPDGAATAEMADYYEEFARGGFGLIITEGIYPDAAYSQGYLNQPGLATDRHADAWSTVTERVHEAGATVVAQLMHAGALSQGNPHRDGTIGPSPVRPLGEMMEGYGGSGPWPIPKEMSLGDVDDVVRGFVDAAQRALDAGFDGVEIHGANGYLLDQFVTRYTNQRADEYGSTDANRIRLTARVVADVRRSLPDGFIVGVRLSQTKVNDLDYRWAGANEAETHFRAVADAGASYIHVASEGRAWLETAVMDGGQTITGIARRVTGLPVIANGGMHAPEQSAQVIQDGHADLVSVGTGALGNPDLPKKIAEGAEPVPFDYGMIKDDVTLAGAAQWRRGR